jgi:carbonic anhydrase
MSHKFSFDAEEPAVHATPMSSFSQYEWRNQPGYNPNVFHGFQQAIPMKTLVIYCFDPRAVDIPKAVANHFGDEVYPGETLLDEKGNKAGSTRTLFGMATAGGRAASALQSIAMVEYLFNVQNVVVVHHSFCGATAVDPHTFCADFKHHHHADISGVFDPKSIAIDGFENSLSYDIELLRASPAVPKHVNLYGFFYDIDSGALIEVAHDLCARPAPETRP